MIKMKTIITLCLLLAVSNLFAHQVKVKCWSNNKIIYNEFIPQEDISMYENYVLIKKDKIAQIITADCLFSQKI